LNNVDKSVFALHNEIRQQLVGEMCSFIYYRCPVYSGCRGPTLKTMKICWIFELIRRKHVGVFETYCTYFDNVA